ncbi:MAG TPA: sigma-70 family RNA polymerase sigma factor [Verrucomicrobiota bacterium]|nr:sigma-70 family RNA polymerase sigma factor [Verrucomicrobiota bacterium]
MKPVGPDEAGVMGRDSVFPSTHWSVVLSAGRQESGEAAQALETLCRTYWYPLYVYVRRRGYNREDAKDLVQGFFAHLLGRDFLRGVGQGKGRFRSFLLASLNHFLSDQRDRSRAAKRGGGQTLISLDADLAERRYGEEAADELTPEIAYERLWATTLLERARARLAEEYTTQGKTDLLLRLEEFPLGERGETSFRDCAARLGLSESALKSAVHRMRARYRELLREEVAHTVNDPAEVADEIRYLITVVSR